MSSRLIWEIVMNRDAILTVENLHVHYGKIHAIQGMSFNIFKGEILTIIGSNGAGKTTTLGALSGLLAPSCGKILFEGKSIGGYRPHKIVARGISLSPEGRFIFPKLTVAENLEMGAYLRQDRKTIKHDKEELFSLFPRLKERIDQPGGTLSGGEQQMLAIARACMARPKLLLLDEPSLGLAPLFVKSIFDNILKINKKGTTILLVEQNARAALKIAHRGIVLANGQIFSQDEASKLLQNENIQKAYLGH